MGRKGREQLIKSLDISDRLPDGGKKIRLKLEECDADIVFLSSAAREKLSEKRKTNNAIKQSEEMCCAEVTDELLPRKKKPRRSNIKEKKVKRYKDPGLPSLSWKHIRPAPSDGEMIIGFNMI